MNTTRHSEAIKTLVANLWAQGKSGEEIAAVATISRVAVYKVARRLGLPKRERGLRRARAASAGTKSVGLQRPPAPDPIGPIGDFPPAGTCRHIAGEPTGAFQCCGHQGYPFCDYHATWNYLPRRGAA